MRQIARFGVPIAVVAGLLALAGAVALVINVVGRGSAWGIISSVAMIAFWAPISYGVGVELRRGVREWDEFLAPARREQDPPVRP